MRAAERVLFFAAILPLALGLWAGAVPKASPEPGGYKTTVDIVPEKENGSCRFKARVAQLANGKTVAAADLTVLPGTPAKADAIDEASGTRMIFNARVEKGTAIYSFDLEREGRTVGKHEGSILLR